MSKLFFGGDIMATGVISKNDLELSLKEAAFAILKELAAHQVKGADLMMKALQAGEEMAEDINQWTTILKELLLLLQPLLEKAREWLNDAYQHLKAIYEWAVQMYHKLFD